jgi:hypothetical protein
MMRKQDYPDNWKEISLQVREEAGQCCEWCGAPNGAAGYRKPNPQPDEREFVVVLVVGDNEGTKGMKWPRLKYYGLTRIVLTVAHLDRDSQNNDRKNLAALCQRCHLRHDIYQHVYNRKYGRYHAKEHQGKLELITSPSDGVQTINR